MSEEKVIHSLIVDAGPILKNEPGVDTLLAKTENLLTTPTTLSEIRDVKTRQRIETQLLPFINLVEPKQTSVDFVSAFAKKSGDFSVLSRTDLELLALTYEKEIERNGESHLRIAPGQRPSKSSRRRNRRRGPKVTESATDPAEVALQDSESLAPKDATAPNLDSTASPPEDDCSNVEGALQDLRLDSSPAAPLPTAQESSPDPTVNPNREPPLPSNTNSKPVAEQDPESDESEDWITPDNLQQHQEKDLHGSAAPISPNSNIRVACLTTDYAMQNVLLQIGLNLLSPSLQRIKQIRTYILRCHGCFQQVKDTSKQFCPRCGNPTLTRVSCSTDDKGQFHLHLKKKMEWNHRGDRYSIPKPVHGSASGKAAHVKGGGKGGWGQQLILTEDQKEYQRAAGPQADKPRDIMDEDYLPDILTGKRGKGRGRPKIGAGRNVNARKRAV